MGVFTLAWLVAILPLASASRALPALKQSVSPTFKIIPSTAIAGPSTARFVSGTEFDGLQVSPINSTSWDWWYFDAVSPDLKTALSIVFYNALPSGFPFLAPSDTVTIATLDCIFENGTQFYAVLEASEAIITTVGDGSSGCFEGTGASWIGAPDMTTYRVEINSPKNGIVGTFELRSLAPAHYPCGTAEAGQSMMVGPNIGWSNAVPDAVGTVDFKIAGSDFAWTGVGYHDKNWSDQPFAANVGSWFWGHGRLGNYSIVWFDFLALNGSEYVSGYAARHGEILTASCREDSVKVRPSGVNDEYPPVASSGFPGGFNITLHLGNESTLTARVHIKTILQQSTTLYSRWAGSMEGSVDGGEVISGGVALLEEFKLV